MASIAWCHERLDEMNARIAREAASKAERIILAMEDFEEAPFAEQRRTGCTHRPYSRWEMSRIIFPRLIADLEAL